MQVLFTMSKNLLSVAEDAQQIFGRIQNKFIKKSLSKLDSKRDDYLS